jgi:hypothetical protein
MATSREGVAAPPRRPPLSFYLEVDDKIAFTKSGSQICSRHRLQNKEASASIFVSMDAIQKDQVARSERFELPTLGFEVRCSIQLSYERVTVRLPDLAGQGQQPRTCDFRQRSRHAATANDRAESFHGAA